MKKKFWIYILIGLGILGVLLLFLLGSFYWSDSPVIGIISFAVLSLIYGLVVLTRKVISHRREKKFIESMLNTSGGKNEKRSSSELAERWRETVDELRKSDLRHRGNPLYVLPWYMLIGESGSGKTTAIKNSRLSSNYASQKRVAGVAGTRNCDWWFFEQAIIVDTAGRYAIPQDEAHDKDEWKEFLRHLSKYRKREPLNGLVVTVSAERLLHGSFQELETDGRLIRERIEELMIQLGSRFPVYVMVTKSDLVQGMKEFCNRLPDVVHEQAFGFLNEDESLDGITILKNAFDVLGDRINMFRLRITNQSGRSAINPKIMLFPEEFGQLKKGLVPFFRGAFDETVYQEPPIIRGLYFTSAHQAGMPISHFVQDLGIPVHKKEEKEEKEGNESFFLHDFFARILPADRYSFSRTRKAMERRRKWGVAGGVAWIVFAVFMGVMLTMSFYNDFQTIRNVRQAYGSTPVLTGVLLDDVDILERARTEIFRLEQLNRHQYVPRFGLNHCDRIERDLKVEYCELLRSDFFQKYDSMMADQVAGFSARTSLNEVGQVAVHYIRRINLLEARMENGRKDFVECAPIPDFQCLVLPDGGDVMPNTLETVSDQYIQYLRWASVKELYKERVDLQHRLEHIATFNGLPLNWIIAWCNDSIESAKLTYSDFWAGSTVWDEDKQSVVDPAFTMTGHTLIKALEVELDNAVSSPLKIEQKKNQFDAFYLKSYGEAWTAFCESYPRDISALSDKELTSVMRSMGRKEGPYFSLINRMVSELAPIRESQSKPEWVHLVYEHSEIGELAGVSSGANGLATANKVVRKKPSFLKRMIRVGRALPKASKEKATLVSAYKEYVDGLKAMSEEGATTRSSLKLASEAFSEDFEKGSSPVAQAARARKELQISTKRFSEQEMVFGELLNGPFECLWSGICRQSSVALQKVWDEMVLAEVQGVYDENLMLDTMFGSRGKAVAFIQGPAAPFIGKDRAKGFYAREVEGCGVQFNAGFLQYLTRGEFSFKSESQQFDVEMDGVPTDVNPEAMSLPSATKVVLQCAEGDQLLENYNFPVSHTFKWSPRNDGAVVLQIYIEDLVLERQYDGFRPFAQFVKDFANGSHEFVPEDFPKHKNSLDRMGIKFIQVKYRIKGGEPVVELLDMEAGSVPEVIVSCFG